MSNPLTYIILLNYKSWKDTIECLESVLKLGEKNFQVILVDNSPTNDSIDNITSWADGKIKNVGTCFPELVYPLIKKPLNYVLISEKEAEENTYKDKKLIFIKSVENRGFSAGNNLALRYIKKVSKKKENVWLLNNDTVVPKNTLTKLIERHKDLKNCGIIGAKLIEYCKPNTIQAIGGNYNSWIGKISVLGKGENIIKNYSSDIKFDYPLGASLFLDVDFIIKVGLMEERYFLYFEEYDWVLRGQKEGYKSYFEPEAIVYHKGGGSSGGNTSELVDFYGIRSKILFTKKFFPYKLLLLYISFMLFVLNRIKRGQYNRIAIPFKLILNPYQEYNETDYK